MESQAESVKSAASLNTVQAKPNNDTSQITIQEFLNFLKTAYQVQESVEGILLSGGMTEAVNWLKRKENQFALDRNSICCQTSDSVLVEANKGAGDGDKRDLIISRSKSCTNVSNADILKKQLNEVLSEGLLDSVLPYLVRSSSSSSVRKNCHVKITEKSQSNQSLHSSNEKIIARRRSSDISVKQAVAKTDSEVEIHVCDEVKNTKKSFVCNQKLLVEKMGYFAEVTQGQRLEDMDISVHCDIGIFEWLMQWVKKESLLQEDWPQLDPQCVIPILVSAAFLQMEPLLNDCLLFCHEHMNEILRTSSNLSCLNDSVLTRLAAMYTNIEVESIKDRKDKIQSRLFTKLIQSLAEPEPESVRGHWCSLAKIFRCEKCQQVITPAIAVNIPCTPPCRRLQPDGSIISLHVRDPAWNINEYIVKLHKSMKTWRKVYWRLWGDCHFLFCVTCKCYFPANQIGWCRYHPDTPQFFTLDAQKAALPIGRFPCCGERAYRFQLLENHSGCQFRQHMVCTQDVRDSAIFTMLEAYRYLIDEEPPQLLFPERLTRLVARDPNSDKTFVCKETFWWDGFEIIPRRPKLGLLTGFADRGADSGTSEESTDECTEEESSSSSSDSEGSAESNPAPKGVMSRKRPKKATESKLWQHNLSARSNQDNQRAYEENAVKLMTALLNRNTITDSARSSSSRGGSRNDTPLGGIWVRLETEWKEAYSQNSPQQKLRNIFTGKFTSRSRGK